MHRARPPVLAVEAAPEADERVLLPLAPDRRLVRVPREHARLGRELHEDVHHRPPHLVGRSTPDRVAKERVPREAEIADDERDAVVRVARGRERLDAEPTRLDRSGCDLQAEALDELVVPGDVIGVPVGDQQVRRRHALALNGGEQWLERGAAVDEDGRPPGLVREQKRVREPGRVHAPLDDHQRGSYGRSPRNLGESRGRPTFFEGGTMNDMFGPREILEDAADRWWIFLLTGIAWLVFALIVFQWDYTTVVAISYLFGIVAIIAGVNEFMAIPISTTGWKWIHGVLGVLFVLVGIYALWNPYDTFSTLAALVGLFLLFKGIFDIMVAFITKDEFELWWLQLVLGLVEILLAFWIAGDFREKAILLVIYVGIIALARGISEIFVAFKLKGLRRRLAQAA